MGGWESKRLGICRLWEWSRQHKYESTERGHVGRGPAEWGTCGEGQVGRHVGLGHMGWGAPHRGEGHVVWGHVGRGCS